MTPLSFPIGRRLLANEPVSIASGFPPNLIYLSLILRTMVQICRAISGISGRFIPVKNHGPTAIFRTNKSVLLLRLLWIWLLLDLCCFAATAMAAPIEEEPVTNVFASEDNSSPEVRDTLYYSAWNTLIRFGVCHKFPTNELVLSHAPKSHQ